MTTTDYRYQLYRWLIYLLGSVGVTLGVAVLLSVVGVGVLLVGGATNDCIIIKNHV